MRKAILFLCLFFGAFGFAQEKTSSTVTPAEKAARQTPPPPSETKIVNDSYWKFHHSAYIGYRRDRQQFNAYGPGILSTRAQLNDRNSMILTLSSHAEIKNLVGSLIGSYGWLTNGQMHLRVPGNAPPLSFPSFDLGAGYQVDARGIIGWRFKLYDRPNLKFSLVPGVGYRYAHMMNYPQGVESFSLPGTNNLAYCQYPKPNQQDWFGYLIDGRVEFLCWDFFEWSFFCEYHRPYLVSRTKTMIEIYEYNGALALISDQLSRTNSVMKSGNLNMVLAGTHLKFAFGPGWAVGTYFEGATTWGKGWDYVRLKQQQFISSPAALTPTVRKDNASIRWTFYSVSVMVDRRF